MTFGFHKNRECDQSEHRWDLQISSYVAHPYFCWLPHLKYTEYAYHSSLLCFHVAYELSCFDSRWLLSLNEYIWNISVDNQLAKKMQKVIARTLAEYRSPEDFLLPPRVSGSLADLVTKKPTYLRVRNKDSWPAFDSLVAISSPAIKHSTTLMGASRAHLLEEKVVPRLSS